MLAAFGRNGVDTFDATYCCILAFVLLHLDTRRGAQPTRPSHNELFLHISTHLRCGLEKRLFSAKHISHTPNTYDALSACKEIRVITAVLSNWASQRCGSLASLGTPNKQPRGAEDEKTNALPTEQLYSPSIQSLVLPFLSFVLGLLPARSPSIFLLRLYSADFPASASTLLA